MKQLEPLIAYSHQVPHFIQQPVTVQQVGPGIQFCPGQKNTVQSVNDIFLWFCPKNKKESKKKKENNYVPHAGLLC